MRVKRYFIPGSEWLYVKLYSGFPTIDSLLKEEIRLLIKRLKKLNLFSKFFFVRYTDHGSHLRLRFLLSENSDLIKIIELLNNSLKAYMGNVIYKVEYDTYVREIERYGASNIIQCETLFHHESLAILTLMKQIDQSQKRETYRWMMALKVIDEYFTLFCLDDQSKLKIIKHMSSSFKEEFGNDKENNKVLKVKYRSHKKDIRNLLQNKFHDKEIEKLLCMVENLKRNVSPVINELCTKASLRKNKKPGALEHLITNIIHMFMNRFFVSNNRVYELVIYDFLYMFYLSENILKRKNNTQLV